MAAPTPAPIDVLALGEAMVEFNRAGGRTVQGFGGDTSNFLVAAARQGSRTGYISAVGDDDHGRALRAMWMREGVDTAHVATVPDAPTGIYFIDHGPGGHEFSFERAGSAASRMQAGDLPRDAIAAAKVLHLSGISLAISQSAHDTCRA